MTDAFTPQTLFNPGRVVATQGARAELQALNPDTDWETLAVTLLSRHLSGDWSELCDEDREQNRLALEHGARIMSVYSLREESDRKIWIITEADRAVTTFLMPEEY